MIMQLIISNNSNTDLRRLFARKLDNLFEIAPDLSYDWWQDR